MQKNPKIESKKKIPKSRIIKSQSISPERGGHSQLRNPTKHKAKVEGRYPSLTTESRSIGTVLPCTKQIKITVMTNDAIR
ncbi:hypothetical protein FGO68_gene10417 [Halteria grandinella]|uniref:Uncharacterized protein n=1 Tax=Halteria grandinella TaxID=5974 RepID=A0A8J8SU30_HALGN|nr:hypothetical protein FGO68_gene10417 [Halteria grandinella]